MNKRSHRLVFSRSLGFCVAVVETVATKSKAASGEGRRGAVKASIGIGLAAASLALQAQGLPGGGAALTGITPRPNLAAGNTASTTLPTGGKVVKGSGNISVNGADMSVNQASQRLVTDWQSFSIGAGNSVRFVQPSSSSVALNRVTGDDASNIFGSLTANGHVYLENANGVYFAPGAHVSVGSLVATSLDVDIAQFVLGKLRLSGGSESSGSVSNAGSIVTASGGSVVLAAPVVSNFGSIATPGGTTALVAGNAVTVDPTGSGLLSISVPAAAVNARLVQSGTITADGGAVQLAAAATDAALRTVMQVDGVVRARSIEQRDGQILLSGGPSGMVIVDGQLDASGGAGAQGGTIKVLGDRVGLTGQGHLDASGATGGGTVLVGGNRHGEGTEANATNTFVGSGVVLDANATANGNGGMIVVWAEGTTTYSGQANARGGASGGNGGAIEVSGKGTLDFQGGADLRAPKGKTGELLLDPTSITIGAIANVDGTPGDDLTTRTLLATDFPGTNSQITGTTVATLLATGDVSLAALRGISVTSPLTVAVGGAASTFSLAAQDVTINAPVTLNNASLVVNGSNSVTTNAALSSLNSISLTSPTISINAPLSAATMSLLTNSNSAFTSITQDSTGAGIVSAGSLTIDGAPGFSVPNSTDLSFSNNKIGALTVNAGDVNLHVGNAPGVPLVLS
ncbi:MAG TPA: filamentous hemagglutinin N-terminal domain-containing protein, partial [Caldimonas sp.]